jgi:hypothetical protein
MIRYPMSLAEIEQRVDQELPRWRGQAQTRTETLIAKGKYEEDSSIWSQVKPIYMRLQHNKCIYCERRLQGGPRGSIAHDLEHYRPKGSIRTWLVLYPFPTGADGEGYYRLAYHLGNYAASCKECNSLLKSNFFPIAGSRVTGKDAPSDYASEDPFLCYPIGNVDEDPEELISFTISDDGPIAIPKYTETQSPSRWRRASVMIRFFDLNGSNLLEDRAFTLLAVWETFKNAQRGDVSSAATLDLFTSPRASHTSCARCFVAFCREVPWQEVESIYLPILHRVIQNANEG